MISSLCNATARTARTSVRIVLVATLLVVPAACDNSPGTKKALTPAKKQQSDAGTEQLLRSVIGILQAPPDPQAFDTVLRQLTQYIERRKDAIEALAPETRTRIDQMLGSDGVRIAERDQFSEADMEYLRGALLLHSIATHLRHHDESNLSQAQTIFEWVVRNVQLNATQTGSEAPPAEVCMRGTGTAEERLWIFVELLRQSGFHGCVIGRRNDKDAGTITPWLGGVIQDGEVYLFEPEIGLPVPSANGGIATLGELVRQPTLLDAFSFPPALPYGISSDGTKGLAVLLIIEPEMLAPRMRFLESNLGGRTRAYLTAKPERLLELAQSVLADIPNHEGVRVWGYPLILRKRFAEQRQEILKNTNLTLWTDPKSPRSLQLRGEYTDAIERLANFDMQGVSREQIDVMFEQQGASPAVRRTTVLRYVQDIPYVLGLCKLEKPDPDPAGAKDWFDRYLTRYSTPLMTTDDVFNWGVFAARLQQGASLDSGHPRQIIWQHLSEQGKDTVKKIVDGRQTVLQKDAGASEIPPRVRVPAQLQETVIGTLNDLVRNADIFRAADLKYIEMTPRLQKLADAGSADIGDEGRVLRNRLVIDSVFPLEIVPYVVYWETGAIRNTAVALHLQGKIENAIALLEQPRPHLAPVHQASFLALAKSYRQARTEPK